MGCWGVARLNANGAHGLVSKTIYRERHAGPRINDDTNRATSLDQAHGQAWVIGNDRARTNHNRVNAGTDAVQMFKRRAPVNVARLARQCCNSSIQRLAELCNYQRF